MHMRRTKGHHPTVSGLLWSNMWNLDDSAYVPHSGAICGEIEGAVIMSEKSSPIASSYIDLQTRMMPREKRCLQASISQGLYQQGIVSRSVL